MPDWQSFDSSQLLGLADAIETHSWETSLKVSQLDLWESIVSELMERNEGGSDAAVGYRRQVEDRRHANNEPAVWETETPSGRQPSANEPAEPLPPGMPRTTINVAHNG